MINKPSQEDEFKKYYNKKIDDIFEKNKNEYPNKHLFEKEKSYERLVNHVKDVYHILIGIPRSMFIEKFGENVEKIVFTKLSGQDKTYNNNYQIMLFSMIIQIEPCNYRAL